MGLGFSNPPAAAGIAVAIPTPASRQPFPSLPTSPLAERGEHRSVEAQYWNQVHVGVVSHLAAQSRGAT